MANWVKRFIDAIATHKANASAHHTPTTRLQSKFNTETRELDAASGDVSYTGYGFKPTALIVVQANTPNQKAGVGFSDSSKVCATYCQRWDVSEYQIGEAVLIAAFQSAAGELAQRAIVKSYDDDGFTLTWTKAGAPAAATVTLYAMALR